MGGRVPRPARPYSAHVLAAPSCGSLFAFPSRATRAAQSLIVLCIFVAATGASAGPFEDGVKAYDDGNFESALALWRPLAEQGLVAAQVSLGVLYENGQGVGQDFVEAAQWYSKAAEQGYAEAQLSVAMFYEKGIGLPLDLELARYWYERAVATPRTDRAALDLKRRARERMRGLPARAGDTTEIVAYSRGRFVLRHAPSGECVVALQGAVTRDAASRFDDVVKKADGIRCSEPLVLLLESPGGLVFDAIDLGERVRARRFRTVVRYGCASACSLIFLGGVERVLWGSRAAIGLHQPSDYDCDQYGTGLGTHRIKNYLRDVVPASADPIIEIITRTSCKSISWIRGDRAIGLGIATKIEARGIDVFGSEASRRESPAASTAEGSR